MKETNLKPGWRWVRLEDVATAYSKRVSDPANSEYERFVSSEHMDRFDQKVKRWGKASDISSSKKAFEPGDYLFVGRSLYASDFRERAARADFPGVSSNGIIAIREKPGMVADGFLSAVLNHPQIWKFVVKNATGTLTRYVYWKTLKEFEFALPPPEEQRRIVEVLQGEQQTNEALREAQIRLTQVRESMGIDIWGNKEITLHMVPLGELSIKIQDGTHFSPHSKEGDYRYITSKNIRNGFLDISTAGWISKDEHDGIYKRCDVKKGDLLLTKDGVNAGNIAINTLDEPFSLLSSVVFIRPDSTKLDPIYLFEYIRSRIGRTRLLAYVKGSAISRLTLTQIRRFKVPLMDIEVQHQYASQLSQIQSSIDQLSNRRSNFRVFSKCVRQILEDST